MAAESWEHLIPRTGRIGYPDFLFFDPRDGDTLFLGGARNEPGKWVSDPMADSIVARSTDGGRTWLELDRGMPSPMAPAFEALCLHHWDGGMMLAVGTATGEIYVSEDDGGSWTGIEDNARPISKDHHHLAWYPKAEREAAMALRRACLNGAGESSVQKKTKARTTAFLRQGASAGAVGSMQAVWKDQRETEPSAIES